MYEWLNKKNCLFQTEAHKDSDLLSFKCYRFVEWPENMEELQGTEQRLDFISTKEGTE